ncbi:tyrosine-type recombinase/integrase [Erythrobacter sp. SCSIO 43205]|uniref:tyrosine-type recombinase/integrase n=1 Tax=Erythrobacter sp. SCSIO 43205 TaxID=2779361 RepID=UPI001CA9C689|nr:integrase arm-type DNA-binding domain-containing protein [Erythrobacter sp. SCSIO 43205]UAB77921.1 tyrosine-type recombinase/integrase [Erythrobacter sp. SCSIO 43205]
MSLTITRLKSLKPKAKPYKVTDGRGLYIEITPSGSKLWRFRYRLGKSQKKICIGSFPEISLAEARDIAFEAKRKVARGDDPALEKRKQKIRNEYLAANTFETVAREYIEEMMVKGGLAQATIVKANYFLEQLAPAIGNRPLADIEPFEVLAPLKRLEGLGKHETAKKTRSFAGRVFRYGVATTRCTTDPTSLLKGALRAPRPTHYAAIVDPKKLGGLLRAIDDFDGYILTKYALQIAPHVFVRPGELRHADWDEFDLDEGIWRIPAGKMKARRAHAVPLSRQVVTLMEELGAQMGMEGYVFPSTRSRRRPMSENALNAAFRRMGYSKEEITAHGLRATASSLLNESGIWSPDAIERALAHGDSDAVRGIYHRGRHWDERVKMAQWWSDHLDELKAKGRNIEAKKRSVHC